MSGASDLGLLAGLAFCLMLLAGATLLLLFSYQPQVPTIGDRAERLLRGAASSAADEEEIDDSEPLRERLLKPILDALNGTFLKLLPAGVMKSIQDRLDSAGNPANLAPIEFLGMRIGFGIGAIFVGLLAGAALLQRGMGNNAYLCGVMVGVCCLMLPDTGLNRAIDDRRYKIKKALPDVIDLLVVCVEAGIGFDGAVAKVVEKSKGPLADEFARVLQEMRLGKLRSQALRDMAKRVGVIEISTFVAAICQAEQTGASLSTTLTAQAGMMRSRRSQRVREAAAKLPVKMLFPLVFCIFPAIFVVLLGSGIIQLVHAFSG
jgi:tight adherence protein C